MSKKDCIIVHVGVVLCFVSVCVPVCVCVCVYVLTHACIQFYTNANLHSNFCVFITCRK